MLFKGKSSNMFGLIVFTWLVVPILDEFFSHGWQRNRHCGRCNGNHKRQSTQFH